MFKRVLIANRGEIALRVIRACRELGVETVAIYSEADKDSLHVRYADMSYCVGPGPSARSYLNIPNIMSAALLSEADAIHPGYGYLAERAHFAEICETHGIKFIGPPVSSIEQMGDKAVAKRVMKEAGVPVVPGSEGAVEDEKAAVDIAEEIGYPVIVKASAGGGGRGMRVAYDRNELLRVLQTARSEAGAAFGSDEVYIEKFLERPRHIEIQVLADQWGNIVHLGERECSLQRRYQKVLEEAPSPFVSPELRREMGASAVLAAQSVGYANAGTVEFLVDRNGDYYFSEMNTRIQVEHPVTEMVTGIDLVKEQIRIAAGERLEIAQSDIVMRGHAIECRINAEDPDKQFRPSPGRIEQYAPPGGPGVRIDANAYAGYEIPPYYDAMFAKLICHAEDRQACIERTLRALDEFWISGVPTTIPFHQRLLTDERVVAGDVSTDFIEREIL